MGDYQPEDYIAALESLLQESKDKKEVLVSSADVDKAFPGKPNSRTFEFGLINREAFLSWLHVRGWDAKLIAETSNPLEDRVRIFKK